MNADDREWLEWRTGGVGASDIAALIGLSNYESPWSLYLKKTGVLEPDEQSQRQRIGKRMETVLAAEFNDATGLYVVGEQEWCEHPDYPWARCTVDGFVSDTPYGSRMDLTLGVVEMKTDSRFGWGDGIPANIRAQVIWQLGVTQLRHSYLIVMFGGFRVQTFEVDWDADAQADWEFMLDVASTFWHDHVLAGVDPPIDDHPMTTAALTRIHTLDPASTLEADRHGYELIYNVRAAMAAAKAAEAESERAKNELRNHLGSHEQLVAYKDGEPVVLASWRNEDRRSIDAKALRSAEPAIADKFTRTTTARVLRVPTLREQP